MDNEAVLLGKILAEVEALKKDVECLTAQLSELHDLKNKYVGAGVVLIAIGSVASWAISVIIDKFYR